MTPKQITNEISELIAATASSRSDIEELEIEARVGRIQNRKFNTYIPKHTLEVAQDFASHLKWEKTEKIEFYEFKQGANRIRTDKSGRTLENNKKKKIKISDYRLENSKYDIRIAISKEDDVQESQRKETYDLQDIKHKRLKIRNKYYLKGHCFVLTSIRYPRHWRNQIEVELTNLHDAKNIDFKVLESILQIFIID